MPLPNWDDDTSKTSRGKLLIIGGSRRLPGAIILAARAALRIGCGTALFAYDVKQKPIAPRILTPHEDEFKALTNGKEVDMTAPESDADEFAQQSNTILVLKGQNTFIATPEGSIFKNEAGSRALGTAGSGDTLAGIIRGLLAQSMQPTAAAVWGVYFHAVAGETVSEEVGHDGAMASDFIDRLPTIQRRLRQETGNSDNK